ncbi:acyl-CoA thioesterase [Allobacillus halotolerans]|uniref:Acyl-CoA thioesterase n=1 Tax=Allobacillus halotolerans TaxID=570278 RepID=A0ABS6GKC5_9BACI|nr:thioesterase family protein [Allobacillus halotolerans]MBU6079413.1 acyl-CoA thioesterase [Allobacillus halotolerans]
MVINETDVVVRYQETDQMGVVYHSNYFVWFEIGRTRLIEQLGFDYLAMEEEGILAPVIDIQASYKTPVRYGQTARVETKISEYNGFRVTYSYKVYTEDNQLSVTGTSTHVCVKKSNFRPISIKKHFPKLHETYLNAVES